MINPIEVKGLWDEGYALDRYTLSSEYIGEDAFGHPVFNNTYSEIGRLLYHFKYNGHLDTREQIAEIAVEFLEQWLADKNVTFIIPCPSSISRAVQPVVAIADKLSEMLQIPYSADVLIKKSMIPTKNIVKEERDLKGQIEQNKRAKRPCNILLIDDVVDSGSTANECVSVLRNDPMIQKIYFLAVTKKRK